MIVALPTTGGSWTCDGCGRVWFWETRKDEPCLMCGCEGGVTVDFAAEAQRRALADAMARARFLNRHDDVDHVRIAACHLRALLAAVPAAAFTRPVPLP